MSNSTYEARRQANRINQEGEVLRRAHRKLLNCSVEINSDWFSEEMVYINSANSAIDRKINQLINLLESLQVDIVEVADEIEREEMLRRKAARKK